MERAHTPEELLSIPTEELEKIIYPVGFYRNKSRLIKEISQTIIEKYHRVVPDTIEELTDYSRHRKKDGKYRRHRRIRQSGCSSRHARPPDIQQARCGHDKNTRPDGRGPEKDPSPASTGPSTTLSSSPTAARHVRLSRPFAADARSSTLRQVGGYEIALWIVPPSRPVSGRTIMSRQGPLAS